MILASRLITNAKARVLFSSGPAGDYEVVVSSVQDDN